MTEAAAQTGQPAQDLSFIATSWQPALFPSLRIGPHAAGGIRRPAEPSRYRQARRVFQGRYRSPENRSHGKENIRWRCCTAKPHDPVCDSFRNPIKRLQLGK